MAQGLSFRASTILANGLVGIRCLLDIGGHINTTRDALAQQLRVLRRLPATLHGSGVDRLHSPCDSLVVARKVNQSDD